MLAQNKQKNFVCQEFVQALSVLLRGTPDQKLKWIFDLYDINHRGYVTEKDLCRVTKGFIPVLSISRVNLGYNVPF